MLAFINMYYNQREYGKAESRKKKKIKPPRIPPLELFSFCLLSVREFNFLLFIFLSRGRGSCLPSHDGWWRGNLEVDVRVYVYAELLA